MVDSKKDLETYVLKALGSMQKQGLPLASVLVKTSPQGVTLIVQCIDEPIRFGNWTAINISHTDFLSIAKICEGIAKGKGIKLQ